jgi:hypothetical protein
VEETPGYHPTDNRLTKFRTRRLYSPPMELLPVSCVSSDNKGILNLLSVTGLQCRFNVDGHGVLLEFADGVVAGPFPLRRRTNSTFMWNPSDPVALVPAWSSRAKLNLIELRPGSTEGITRTFLSTVSHLPDPELSLDLTSPEQALSSLLKTVCRDGPGSFLLSKKDQSELVRRLAGISDLDLIARRDRLQRVLEEAFREF